ncbi:hypothetical protein BGC_04090 [Burkholderia sp. 3C]
MRCYRIWRRSRAWWTPAISPWRRANSAPRPSTVSRQIKRFDEPADLANDVSARLDAALDGWGIARLPEFAAENALRRGDLVPVLADWQCEAGPYMGPIGLLYPPNRFLPPKVRVLIDHLASHLHDTGAA